MDNGPAPIEAYNIADLREHARRMLPKGLFEFIDRGTEDETALRGNRDGFDRIRFLDRVLVDVSARTLETQLFGQQSRAPLIVAPTGAAGLLWLDGEIARCQGCSQGRHPVHAVHGVDRTHGAGCGRGGRAALVPAVHVA